MISSGKKIGYIRVSSIGQNTDRQLDGVKLDKIFTDKVSGKNMNRPELQQMLEYVREGDVVYVHSMSRMARNLGDLRNIVMDLTTKRISIIFNKENLTFSGDDSPMSMLLLNMMGAVAEFERDNLLMRQREGIKKAKDKKKYKGKKKILNQDQIKELKIMVDRGDMKTKIGLHFGITSRSVYRYMKL